MLHTVTPKNKKCVTAETRLNKGIKAICNTCYTCYTYIYIIIIIIISLTYKHILNIYSFKIKKRCNGVTDTANPHKHWIFALHTTCNKK